MSSRIENEDVEVGNLDFIRVSVLVAGVTAMFTDTTVDAGDVSLRHPQSSANIRTDNIFAYRMTVNMLWSFHPLLSKA